MPLPGVVVVAVVVVPPRFPLPRDVVSVAVVTVVVRPGQPPGGAGTMSPWRSCAGSARELTVIRTYGFRADDVLWQIVTFPCVGVVVVGGGVVVVVSVTVVVVVGTVVVVCVTVVVAPVPVVVVVSVPVVVVVPVPVPVVVVVVSCAA